MAAFDFKKMEVVDHDGKSVDVNSFTGSGKVFGLYFSAHWCPPCKGFTPVLSAFYTAMKAANPNFEIVFISSDKDDDAFDNYFKEMPWLAIKYGSSCSHEISNHFKIQGIPTFVILKGTGEVVTNNGRSCVSEWKSNGTVPDWIK